MPYCAETCSKRSRFNDFLRLPFRIYEQDSNWITAPLSEVRRTLDPNRNPYFEHAILERFVCRRGEETMARTVVVINRDYWKKFGEKTAFFGFFESLQDSEAVRILFEAVATFCRTYGVNKLEGPFNPNHYSELGLKTDRFDSPPVFFETHNPPYYYDLLRKSGFRTAYPIHTRKNEHIAEYIQTRYGTIRSSSQSGGFTIRPFNMHKMSDELERIREVYNDAFSENAYFLPVSRQEYLFSAKFLRMVTYPDLIRIVEYKNEPVGVLQCMLNINPLLQSFKGRMSPYAFFKFLKGKKQIKELVIYAVGIKKTFQHTRAYKLILDALCGIALKYQTLYTTWMSEKNVSSIRAAEHVGLVPDKHFVILSKSI